MKKSTDIRELCYPFIYENSSLCDYEIITDEMCTTLGMAISTLENKNIFSDLYQIFCELQPLLFDLNGSIRGKQAIFENHIDWLKLQFENIKSDIPKDINGFILPRGGNTVQLLHRCRSQAKKSIRALVKVHIEGITVPDELHRFTNLLCNFFFRTTLVINSRLKVTETSYQSNSYRK